MDILKQIDENNLNFMSQNVLIKRLAEINHENEFKIKKEINNLIESGELINTSKKKLATSKKVGILEGKITITKAGYGFFIPDDSTENDVFIPVVNLNGAMHNDRVIVQKNFKSSPDKPDGKVIKILNRGLNVVVGKVVSLTKNFAMVTPDSKRTNDITIKLNSPNANIFGAKKGDKVVVKLTKFDNKRPEGKIIEVLISDNPVNVDVLSIVRDFELYEEFPKEVLVAADRVKTTIDEKTIKNRTDLRHLKTFTIDGEDARDFDDAVSCENLENGNVLLGVHIADVGEYVPYGSVLDAEAFKRGTSTYFPNAVFPMLPKQLSNEICSLNEGVDRLTLTCFMEIDKNGKIVSHKICESVINSKARLTYTKVQKILDGDEDLIKQYSFLVEDINKMKTLALKLEKVRNDRGCLNFEIPEPKIILNDKLEIERFEKRPVTMADRIIESFMLAANETVAKEFENRHLPFVYRVHEKPNKEKLEGFKEFVESLGFKFKGDLENLDPKTIQKFLESVPEEKRLTVNKVLLRSMQKAKYSPACMGHYGLGAQYYCHFTSPIRRYPDLTIHRIIKDFLRKDLSQDKIKLLKAFVAKSAQQSSERETISDKAEIQVDEYFKARYMASHVGEIFDGTVSGVTERGIFVELENTCEGFVFVETLPDKVYNFIENKLTLIGSSTKFTIGDSVRIKVASADIESRKINFNYVGKSDNKNSEKTKTGAKVK